MADSNSTTKIADGGSAFPTAGWWPGMSLRDWFAGQALIGALSGRESWPFSGNAKAETATECYALADAFLKERAK